MEPSIPVENRANLPPLEFAQLATAISRHRSIKHALDWLASLTPPLAPTDMVTQDEYSHDILVPYPNGFWLIYDST